MLTVYTNIGHIFFLSLVDLIFLFGCCDFDLVFNRTVDKVDTHTAIDIMHNNMYLIS